MKETPMEPEALRIIKRDHKRIGDLLFHFEQSEEPSHKLSFAETAMNELAIHTVIEEELIYPLLVEKAGQLASSVHHSMEEHQRMDALMQELIELKQVDENYIEVFSELAEMIADHVEDEERDLLPSLAPIATAELAQRISDLKDELSKYDRANDVEFSPQVILLNRLHERRRSA